MQRSPRKIQFTDPILPCELDPRAAEQVSTKHLPAPPPPAHPTPPTQTPPTTHHPPPTQLAPRTVYT
uniref:Uncharacterized protein n=1 Tax=Callorhinchus milii TaxID=7868 RepID=A0A4W3JL98_CALMI